MHPFARVILSFAAFVFLAVTHQSAFAEAQASSVQKELAKLEAGSGGRLGVAAINTGNDHRVYYRAEERFPLQSTFKLMGVSAVLKKSMTDKQLVQEKIVFNKQNLTEWSPITKQHLSEGMTIVELCAAAIMYSDNTAIDLLTAKLGGPEAVVAFARSIGDKDYQLQGNYGISTPQAMQKSLQNLVLTDVLASPQREQLIDWLKGNTTGKLRIRAGVPKGWVVGDKTGTGPKNGITNDIAVVWPPHCSPLVMAIYFTHDNKPGRTRPDVLASAARILVREFARSDHCIKA